MIALQDNVRKYILRWCKDRRGGGVIDVRVYPQAATEHRPNQLSRLVLHTSYYVGSKYIDSALRLNIPLTLLFRSQETVTQRNRRVGARTRPPRSQHRRCRY